MKMSEADKIIENLKNSGRKVEEFYTGNKTSDKNVANIEDDVNMIHKIISFYKDLDTLHNNDKCKEIQALEHLLAEREQKDKRIQELEEENKKVKAQHVFTRNKATDKEKAELYDTIDKTLDTFLEEEKPIWQQEMTSDKMGLEEALNIVDVMYQDRYKIAQENNTIYVDRLKNVEFTNLEFASVRLLREVQSLQSKLKNSIPTQVVIDAINKHKLAYEEFNKKYSNTRYENDEIRARDFYMIVTEDRIIQVLQKLLEGGK